MDPLETIKAGAQGINQGNGLQVFEYPDAPLI